MNINVILSKFFDVRLILLPFFLAGTVGAQDFHSDPSCWRESRYYHSLEEDASTQKKIRTSRVEKEKFALQNMKWDPSPNRAYRLTTLSKTRSRPDSVSLLVDVEQPYYLRIDIEDGVLAEPRWVNEKLIFFRAWWGRIRATDTIYDVEAEKIRVADMLHDGSTAFKQYREGCSAGMKCKCKSKDNTYKVPHSQEKKELNFLRNG